MNRSPEQATWAPDVQDFIQKHNLVDAVSVGKLKSLLESRTASWKVALPGDSSLYFLKLHVPLVEREEVLTGNLLFGDFVRKCALEAMKLKGEALALTGDLDDAYYLAVSRGGAEELTLAVREHVESRLVDLFFGEDDPERGVHGSPINMFGFTKSDFEPYPVFAVPTFLANDLYESFTGVLKRKVDGADLILTDPKSGARRASLDLRNIQATIAFFYGRTSGGSGDVQSPANFLRRLVIDYGVLDEDEVVKALRLREFDKVSIKDSFDTATLDEVRTRELFRSLIQRLQDAKGEDAVPEDSWFLPFIRENGKLLDASPEQYLNSILDGAFLGFTPLGEAERGDGLVCRVCGSQVGPVGEKNILLGISVGKFYNQSSNTKKAAKICPRCALFSFLNTKLFGMTSAGKFPVPSRENLIFHYGRHTEADVERLGALANKTMDLARRLKEIRRETSELNKKLKEARPVPLDAGWQTAQLQDLAYSENDPQLREALYEAVEKLFDEPNVEQVIAAMSSRGDIKVFSLGAGSQRLIIFTLPHFRDELELADRRFSKSRSTVFSLMAFLSDLCGCDGPFFFQGKPRLETSGSRGVFYIRDRPYEAERYRRRYEVLSKFAYHAVENGPKALEGRLKLAIELEEAPLATFDSVLRASPIRPGDKPDEAKYRRAVNEDGRAEYDQRLKVFSPWEYLGFFDEMSKLEREERLGDG